MKFALLFLHSCFLLIMLIFCFVRGFVAASYSGNSVQMEGGMDVTNYQDILDTLGKTLTIPRCEHH